MTAAALIPPASKEHPTVTDTAPYTAADLRAEAARQHHDLTTDPDYMGVGESMEDRLIESTVVQPDHDDTGSTWGELLDEDQFDTAQRQIHDLINKAADTSAWAVALGAAGLEPGPSHGWACHGEYDVAIHIATSPQLRDDARERLTVEIQRAVDATIRRVLGAKPEGGAL